MRRGLCLLLAALTVALLFLAPTGVAVEGDIAFQRKGGNPGPSDTPVAVFPHWVHRIRYKCYACHPAIFEMKAGANDITMDAMSAGKSCGVCHNGKIAWAVSFETCNRCHREK